MRKKFIVEVPCTTVDQYIVFAESVKDAYDKMASGSMIEHTTEKPGDYAYHGQSPYNDPFTDWDQATVAEEVAA